MGHFITYCKCLQGFTGTLRGLFCNIFRENPAIFTDCRGIAWKICKYYRVFPADIAENPRRVPVNPCKHLQCRDNLATLLRTLIPANWFYNHWFLIWHLYSTYSKIKLFHKSIMYVSRTNNLQSHFFDIPLRQKKCQFCHFLIHIFLNDNGLLANNSKLWPIPWSDFSY